MKADADGAPVGSNQGKATHDLHRGQCRDERIDVEFRNDETVDEAYAGTAGDCHYKAEQDRPGRVR